MYSEVIRRTIAIGGDTDTNACIVGALVGAVVGVTSIPNDMLLKLISYDTTYQGRKRANEMHAKNAIYLVKDILQSDKL